MASEDFLIVGVTLGIGLRSVSSKDLLTIGISVEIWLHKCGIPECAIDSRFSSDLY